MYICARACIVRLTGEKETGPIGEQSPINSSWKNMLMFFFFFFSGFFFAKINEYINTLYAWLFCLIKSSLYQTICIRSDLSRIYIPFFSFVRSFFSIEIVVQMIDENNKKFLSRHEKNNRLFACSFPLYKTFIDIQEKICIQRDKQMI